MGLLKQIKAFKLGQTKNWILDASPVAILRLDILNEKIVATCLDGNYGILDVFSNLEKIDFLDETEVMCREGKIELWLPDKPSGVQRRLRVIEYSTKTRNMFVYEEDP